MTTTALIIADNLLIGKVLQESLHLTGNFKTDIIYDKDGWNEELCQELKENKESNIILAGFDDENLSSWIWQTIRSEKDIQNPIVVLGYEREAVFCSKHTVFRDGTAKYHRYLAAPWEVNNLERIMQEIKPLQGDNDEHREGIFIRFGDTNLYTRIFRRLHVVKCCGGEKEIFLAVETETLSKQLQDEDLQYLTKELVEALRSENLDSAIDLKEQIEENIKKIMEPKNGKENSLYR